MISTLEGKLKWSEDSCSRANIFAKAVEQEACIEDVTALLRDAERDVHRARDELGNERNRCIVIEDNFNVALESSVNKSVADALERARLEVEVERERKRETSGGGCRGGYGQVPCLRCFRDR